MSRASKKESKEIRRVDPDREDVHGGPVIAEHRARYEWAVPFLNELFPGEKVRVLDLGCGTGYGSRMLAEAGHHVTGTDLAPEAIEHCRRMSSGKPNETYAVEDACNLQQPSESFDVVINFEVIEHVPLPNRVAAEAFRVLKDGGSLILSTPNRYNYPVVGYNPDHVREYRPEEIYTLLRSEGFTGIRFFGLGTDDPVLRKQYYSPLNTGLIKIKRRLGINFSIMPKFLRPASQAIVTGSRPKQATSADYRITENWFGGLIMLFVARKPSKAE